MQIVDLFCGIGGVAEATRGLDRSNGREGHPIEVRYAIDIDRRVGPLYAANHGVTPVHHTLESIRQIPTTDLWWLSPPCQPYTRRGRRLGERDSRSQAMAHLLTVIPRDRPLKLVLENVPEFAGSAHHRQLISILDGAGYRVREDLLCPTQFGVPMRRRRFYLRARRDSNRWGACEPRRDVARLRGYLNEEAWNDPALRVEDKLIERYASSIRLLDPKNPRAVATCFTAAYGRSPVRSGAYLYCGRRGITRRFAPVEIQRLLGFRSDFWWPPELELRTRYHLLGNSLSVTVVRSVLQTMC